jgi:hypothetical protein
LTGVTTPEPRRLVPDIGPTRPVHHGPVKVWWHREQPDRPHLRGRNHLEVIMKRTLNTTLAGTSANPSNLKAGSTAGGDWPR